MYSYYVRELKYHTNGDVVEIYRDYYKVSDTHICQRYMTNPFHIPQGWGEPYELDYNVKTMVAYYDLKKITEEEFYNSIALAELAK